MKCNVMLLVIATALATTPAAGHAQQKGSGLLTHMASWLQEEQGQAKGCTEPSCTSPVGCCTPVGPGCYAEDFYCTDGCCGDCCGCCREINLFGSMEFLLWWAKGTSTPPLVTTSPAGTPQLLAGVLPGATILFGNEQVGHDLQAGGRVTFGRWMDCERNLAVSCRFWALGGDETRFAANSTDFPILAQPFIDAGAGGQESSLLLGFPGVVSGGVSINHTNRNVLGTDVLLAMMMERDCNRRFDLVFGYQFARLDDSLQIDSIQNIPPPPVVTVFDSTDRFTAKNQFHGASVGMKAAMARGCWSWDLLGKLGVGNMRQQVIIDGSTTATPGPITVPGGLYSQPSNIGTFERNELCFVPELTSNITYHVNCCLSFHFGYNIIWFSDVATSGDQLDRRVNLGQPTPPLLPAFAFRDRDYWLQGINLGMNWDF